MGTRNLTIVVKNGTHKVAQYGQWDGYPEGQGATALEFLSEGDNQLSLEIALLKCKFVDPKEFDKAAERVGAENGWMTSEQAAEFRKIFPFSSRDHGADILKLIADSKDDEIELSDQYEFAGDSLMCEWAYVIDFDKRTFEVYKGFNQTPLPPNERFASMPGIKHNHGGVYYPVKHLVTFSLDTLPTKEQFIEACKVKDEEEVA